MAATTRLIALGAAALVLAACSSSSSSTSLDSDSAPQGNPATYQRIASHTDCVVLQAEFDRFEREAQKFRDGYQLTNAEIAVDYMGAVDRRMRAIGCYS